MKNFRTSVSLAALLLGASSISAQTLTASAHVTGDVEAFFNFTYIENEGVRVEISRMFGFSNITQNTYPFHVHVNSVPAEGDVATRCGAALYHLDPLNVTEAIVCSRNIPGLCQEGDLSGKHGGINAYASGSPPTRSFTDAYLRFFPQPFSILGRSVVIHGPAGQRLGCGNIISQIDGTMDANGQATNQASNYQDAYAQVNVIKPPTSIRAGNGSYGTQVNTAGISSAGFTLPVTAIPVESANNVILTTSNGRVAEAVAATSYVQGASLPVQSSASASVVNTTRAIGANNVGSTPNPSAAAASNDNTGSARSTAELAGILSVIGPALFAFLI